LEILLKPIDSLVAYARNSRDHSADQVDKLAGAIVDFGWTNPILADDVSIVAGHGRLMAAKKIYEAGKIIRWPNKEEIPAGQVPVLDCTGWSDAQRRAYIIWDNRSAELATWSLELLKIELDGLMAEGFDVMDIGFSPDDMAVLFADIMPEDEGPDPDEVPEPPVEPFSKAGDIWECGPHKACCGSSTDPLDWDALMGTERADLQVCDPPYNVDFHSDLAGSIKNDNMKDSDFRKFLNEFYACSFSVMKPGAAFYISHADTEGENFRGALKGAGFALKACLIWVKNSLVLGRGDFHYRHEPILYATKPGGKRLWFGGRKQTTLQLSGDIPAMEQLEDGNFRINGSDNSYVVSKDAIVEVIPTTIIHYNKPSRSALHPTMKPVGLWERLIKNHGRPKDIVIDGFGGSGTTMIAAERLGMCARLMELDPRFVDVICVRYFMMTGRIPVHCETGEAFPREIIDRLMGKVDAGEKVAEAA